MTLETLAKDIAASAEAQAKAMLKEAKAEAKTIVGEAETKARPFVTRPKPVLIVKQTKSRKRWLLALDKGTRKNC